MIDIPTVTSKRGIINSVRKYKEGKDNKNDCWTIALSLATGYDYNIIRETGIINGLINDDGTIDSGNDRILLERLGFKVKMYSVDLLEAPTIERVVPLLKPFRELVIWCGNGEYSHLMFSTNNEVWDDKKTRLGWVISHIYEVRRIKDE